MFILMGEKNTGKILNDGVFYCPVCECQQHYQHIQQRNMFTLFFIPLLPLPISREYLECAHCHNSFHPQVVDERNLYPTWHYAALRLMLEFLPTGKLATDKQQVIWEKLGGTMPDASEIRAAQQTRQDDRQDVLHYLQNICSGLNPAGELKILDAVLLFAKACYGEPLPHPVQVLCNQIASTLELEPGIAQQRLLTLNYE
ncbi:zinc-ribbon domain-containing protein [Candidatus Venteria ishoeyi]|uniref:zinc-ribbon domain-containing protein n=1 Tax=Candidatus Venteria ishoeyi TaxID=1899563 RepID=UPI0025A4FBAE|nr:zinc-ribbon domain-containing protein [Candidatus Venteria ishoeyi]MDM8547690.1 zinc-ribbon domain-containing protein [Candidatus Venteria ishoeyi]